MSSPALELQEVSRCYDGGVRALDRVSLSIGIGEAAAVIGASGSGKSTLLNLAGLLDRPSEGRMRLLGSEPPRRGSALDRLRNLSIGFVFQMHYLLPHLTLQENVTLALAPRGVKRSAAGRRAAELLEMVGLAHRAHFLPTRVSSGERQRAALARALANDPAIILADEPTGSLDSTNGHHVLDLLLSAAAGKTLVVVTHNPQIAGRLSRVIELADGRVVSDRCGGEKA